MVSHIIIMKINNYLKKDLRTVLPFLPQHSMAIHFSSAVEAEATAYSGRITLFVVLSCVTAAMGGVIFGYDIGVSGDG